MPRTPRSLGRRAVLRAGAWGVACAALPASVLAGCGAALVPVEGRRHETRSIDRDRFALLPGRILALADLDLTALFATAIGADVATLIQSVVPLGPESGFSATRDTTRLSGGVYAMQGVDFCAVVQGRFDVASIQRAADARASVASGLTLVKSRYGDRDLYTAGNLGFVLLSAATMIAGNETGIRRAIDRLRFRTLERSIPEWMIALAETPGASFTISGDFGADSLLRPLRTGAARKAPRLPSSPAIPVMEAAAGKFPFLSGLRAMRMVGNFQPPGLNFAGTLSYGAADKAANGAEGLRGASQLAQWSNMLTGANIPPMRLAISGTDVGFVQPIETGAARALINLVRSMT